MLQGNNAALLGAQAVVDTSGLSDQFRDGQKLRQEYDARQTQKELGKIMQTQDYNGRLEQARQSRYAGSLIPTLQKYEQDRLTAEQTYNQGQADINKTNAEVGKLGAESGEIGAKTTGLVRENTAGIQNDISALAVTQDPKLFALGLGEMTRQGLITPERTDMMIKMLVSDPQNAAKVMQSMVMANPELAKLFQPKSEVLDAKDGAYLYTTNGFTGEANEPAAKIGYGVSATDQMKDDTSRANNQYTVDAGERNNTRSTQASMYGSDNSYNASVYGADSRAATASDAQAIAWYNGQNKANTDAVNAETNRIKANKTGVGGVDANGKPVARKLEANERSKIFELQEQIDADIGVGESLNRLSSLVEQSYSGAGAGFRGTAMSRLPFVDKTRANATVVSENIAIELALKQLKSTFGAAPTEGERKILMDLQASVDKTPEQKQKIIAAALRASAARVRYRKKQQEAIRTGSYAMPKGNSSSSAKPKAKNNAGASIIGGILGGS
ncbi:hypothetical protein [Psychrobacter sp. K31L]|uniref:hypothetical protein n=1 Tax=Psychrobacter sp. K31L TaxID=2820758 RepID=UPI001B31A4E5|nr:hypothetical protein [Psychrobacter sp. K31L]MBP3945117.1 hypothetical protein [Psychrobacter sp. K31L]